MERTEKILGLLKTHKGAHVRALWRRGLKTRKGVNALVEKTTAAFVRAGINYANLAAVREGIANGERGEVQSLPWGQWQEFPFVITHKGQAYVRLYPAVFANLRPQVAYTIDGQPATREQAESLCLASEFPKAGEEKPACFTIKAESLLAFNKTNI